MAGGNEDGSGHDQAYRAPAHDDEPTGVSNQQLKQRGKMWVALMMVALGANMAFNLFVDATNGARYTFDVRGPITGLLLLLLLLLVHGGKNWARWVVIVWLVLAVIAIAWLERGRPRLDLPNVIRKGVGLWTLGMLLFSPSIRALVNPPPRRWSD